MAVMKEHGQADIDAFSRMTKGATGATPIVYPSTLLKQKEKRDFGGLDVEFIFSNDGHSTGDILMWLPKQKIIFGGDVLSSDWMPIMTPSGNVPNLIDTLNAVIKLNPTIVLPGHGKVTTVKSVKRDVKFLASIWHQIKTNKGNKFGSILAQVINQSEQEYKALYEDFDSSIEYLVKMMIEKQKQIEKSS
jgi:glyoxylase-like metal-dependent hydrolase (beta-lactamase superfamily II)